jgi:hypothetical protein
MVSKTIKGSNRSRVVNYLFFSSILSALFGILFVSIVSLSNAGSDNFIFTLGNLTSYFTNQSNFVVAIASILLLINYKNENIKNVLAFGAAVNIALTGIVYILVLQGVWDPKGFFLVGNILLHYVTPVVYLTAYFLSKSNISFDNVMKWLIAYPLVYGVYTFVRGYLYGWYPYFFIDVNVVGNNTALINAFFVWVTILILGVGAYYLTRFNFNRVYKLSN